MVSGMLVMQIKYYPEQYHMLLMNTYIERQEQEHSWEINPPTSGEWLFWGGKRRGDIGRVWSLSCNILFLKTGSSGAYMVKFSLLVKLGGEYMGHVTFCMM